MRIQTLFLSLFLFAATTTAAQTGAEHQAEADKTYQDAYLKDSQEAQSRAFEKAAGQYDKAAEVYRREGNETKAKDMEAWARAARSNADSRRKKGDPAAANVPSDLETLQLARVVGTGRTTGHIAEIVCINPANQPLALTIPPCYIPSRDNYQPYILPYPILITVPPNGSSTTPIPGFCTDIRRPPVPAGAPMPDPGTWVFPDPTIPASTYFSPTVTAWTPGDYPGAGYVPTIPGTNTPSPYRFDEDQHPELAAGVFLNAITRIIDKFDSLRYAGIITTPFSRNPEQESQAVVQQTFWMYAGLVRGEEYDKDDFTGRLIGQWENTTKQPFARADSTTQEQLRGGSEQFWDAFTLVGVEAKVIVYATFPSTMPLLGNLNDISACVPANAMDVKKEVDSLINKLNKLAELFNKAKSDLENNDLYKERKAIESMLELLKTMRDLDQLPIDIFSDLKAFINCNSQPLKDRLKTTENGAEQVSRLLRFFTAFLKAHISDNKKLSAVEKFVLKKAVGVLDKKIRAMEEALAADNIDLFIEIFDSIKTEEEWPTDVLKKIADSVLDEIVSDLKQIGQDLGEKIAIKIIGKILGSANAATAIVSIAKDLYDFLDILIALDNLDEARRRYNQHLLRLIRYARDNGVTCSGAGLNYWWNFGKAPSRVTKVEVSVRLICWCPKPGGQPGEGEWKDAQLELEPNDGAGTKKYTKTSTVPPNTGETKFNAKLPPKASYPCPSDDCYLMANLTTYDKDGNILGTQQVFAGAAK